MRTEVITQKESKPSMLCLAGIPHPLKELVICWWKENKELEDKTVTIKQSYNLSQHPCLI